MQFYFLIGYDMPCYFTLFYSTNSVCIIDILLYINHEFKLYSDDELW